MSKDKASTERMVQILSHVLDKAMVGELDSVLISLSMTDGSTEILSHARPKPEKSLNELFPRPTDPKSSIQ